VRRLLFVTVVAMASVVVAGSARADHQPAYTDSCTATSLGATYGYWIVNIGESCHIDGPDPMVYSATGSWRLEILRPGKHPAGEWLDKDGNVVIVDTPERPVVRTRIVLTQANALPACGSAMERGDSVRATVSGAGSTIQLTSPPGGGAVEAVAMATAFPGDHRNCLR
jgi:hypothetical protein